MTEQHRTLESLAGRTGSRGKTVVVDPHPAAVGRWQPTRAGAVNSWQWSEEQFLYSSGWLALVGMNGSGKSLTSGVLCPTFIDGEISSKSLSASGEAAGTLTSIHTQGRSGPAKTGAWWQEYGRTDSGPDGRNCTQWLTAGLWLKTGGGERSSLERAWFLVPARVHAGLTLAREGMPVDIEDLAAQLAEHGGLLFTSNTRLENACKDHAAVVRGEDEYPEAVRTAMYQPLDASQIEALGSVLRALRSVQANDKVSPSSMRATLTSALPSLDVARVQSLADALAKTEQLQNRLRDARREQEVLNSIRKFYRRYVAAAAASAAVGLRDDHARHGELVAAEAALKERKAQQEEGLQAAGEAIRDGEQQLVLLGRTIKSLESRVHGHPGGNLDELAVFAQQQEERASRSVEEARGGAEAQQQAEAASVAASGEAETAIGQLGTLTRQLGRSAGEVGGGAFHASLDRVAGRLAQTRDEAPVAGLEQEARAAREQAGIWLDAQATAGEEVSAAISHLAAKLDAQEGAQERHDAARRKSEAAVEWAQSRADEAEQAEDAARQALQGFSARLVRLSAPPHELVGGAVLDPQAISAWLEDASAQALADLDLTGVQAHARALADGAASAAARAEAAQITSDEAGGRLAGQADDLAQHADGLAQAPEAVTGLVEKSRVVADFAAAPVTAGTALVVREEDLSDLAEAARGELGQRRELLHAASKALDASAVAANDCARLEAAAAGARSVAEQARRQADETSAKALKAGQTWASGVQEWANSLTVLERDRLRLPAVNGRPVPPDAQNLRDDAATAYQLASTRITADLTSARMELSTCEDRLADLDDAIAEAKRSEARPGQPAWRPSRANRAGAPLWALVNFAGHLPEDEAGRLEGALLTAGLLDAWVSPDGELSAGDVCLVATTVPKGPTLADLLVPDAHGPLPAELVQQVLAGIQVVEHGEQPAAGQAAFAKDGTVHLGPLIAQSPMGWIPRYIGATARERMRQLRLTELREQHAEAAEAVDAAEDRVEALATQLATADSEQTSYPDPGAWLQLETAATATAGDAERQEGAAQQAVHAAEIAAGTAAQAQRAATVACDNAFVDATSEAVRAAQEQCADLPGLVAACLEAARTAIACAMAMHHTAVQARNVKAAHAEAEASWQAARRAAEEIEKDRSSLPAELADVLPTRAGADEAQRLAAEAAGALIEAEQDLGRHSTLVREATSALHHKARMPHGSLPLEEEALRGYRSAVRNLQGLLGEWAAAATRAYFTLATAATRRAATQEAQRHAGALRSRAEADTAAATAARHHHNEELRQHDQSFRDLQAELEQRRDDEVQLRGLLAGHQREEKAAEVGLALAIQELTANAQALHGAAVSVGTAVGILQGLFDHGLVDELAEGELLSRPEDAAEGIHVARLILEQRGLSAELRAEQARLDEQSARGALEGRIRKALEQLLRIRRHVTTEEAPGTGWRRIVVTEHGHDVETGTSALGAKTLRQALGEVESTIASLEADFNDQVQSEVKGVVFSELRKDINVRIHTAEQIVNDIRTTLKDVRTGVARVGVKLDWIPKTDDPVALKALSLIRDANHEGSFDQMYDFFVEQLKNEETNHPTWAKRVEHVFDYRNWYTWEISVTHRSFSEDPNSDDEVFKAVTPRRNPLAKLSAGEQRLATMLPLLAAAHAFYSTAGYEGPRAVFIDELNAAFDAPNLRMLLKLLRTWDFDAIVTLPAMQPLLVAETGAVGIHRIHQKSDTMRYTIPSVWTGRGTPQTARIRVGQPATDTDAPERSTVISMTSPEASDV
ncbi:SbcC/MukB-like Walker B domain-containing protein [Kitasatospora aureofaciens]|uniref:SbcC/MukB-like Walker B domain-containing protein n=1 Tax=Kitasatospora aureofaciens TaxID=1894 RepID=UPI00052516A1|nr:SbcC/MukB-like Walker B domain-containing protein [Kitasatospora aureofaciens]